MVMIKGYIFFIRYWYYKPVLSSFRYEECQTKEQLQEKKTILSKEVEGKKKFQQNLFWASMLGFSFWCSIRYFNCRECYNTNKFYAYEKWRDNYLKVLTTWLKKIDIKFINLSFNFAQPLIIVTFSQGRVVIFLN